MASKLIGRSTCPECGFESAHIKESEKCVYRYCPECGSQHYARNQRQRDDLLKKTRASATSGTTATGSAEPLPVAVAVTSAAEPVTTGSETTATPPKRRGLFS